MLAGAGLGWSVLTLGELAMRAKGDWTSSKGIPVVASNVREGRMV